MAARVPTNTAAPSSAAVPSPAPLRPLRSVPVLLDDLGGGRVRVSSPLAPGWATVASGPHATWRALDQAMNEVRRAAEARWSGGVYELEALTEQPARPPSTSAPNTGVGFGKTCVVRPDQAHPSRWTPTPEGHWVSPKGRTYRSPGFCERMVERRAALGLATNYDDWSRRPA